MRLRIMRIILIIRAHIGFQIIYIKHRDQRFYASIAYDSTYIYENLVVTRITGNMHRKSLNKASKAFYQNRVFCKKDLI